jgi:hypothetical protein
VVPNGTAFVQTLQVQPGRDVSARTSAWSPGHPNVRTRRSRLSAHSKWASLILPVLRISFSRTNFKPSPPSPRSKTSNCGFCTGVCACAMGAAACAVGTGRALLLADGLGRGPPSWSHCAGIGFWARGLAAGTAASADAGKPVGRAAGAGAAAALVAGVVPLGAACAPFALPPARSALTSVHKATHTQRHAHTQDPGTQATDTITLDLTEPTNGAMRRGQRRTTHEAWQRRSSIGWHTSIVLLFRDFPLGLLLLQPKQSSRHAGPGRVFALRALRRAHPAEAQAKVTCSGLWIVSNASGTVPKPPFSCVASSERRRNAQGVVSR